MEEFFSPHQRYKIPITLSINLLGNSQHFQTVPNYVYPFEICQQDVTDKYNVTSDIKIDTDVDKISQLKDTKYVYIAMAVNNGGPQWRVLDFGTLKRGKANFRNMGRNMLYIALGYNGKELIPISHPFILHKDGGIQYIDGTLDSKTISMDLRRKYYESYNVVDMRRRMIGGKFQCSDHPDFKDAVTLYTIEHTDIPYLIETNVSRPYRYWRYLSPDGSWGSISEVSFHDAKGDIISGRGIANPEAGQDAIDRAYDGNLLSNFEINQPNGNWIGMDMGKPTVVSYVSVSPRSDDNDICPGNEYELFYYSGDNWYSLGYKVAKENTIKYKYIPTNTLLWLKNYTRGNNERPYIIGNDNEIQWW